MANEKSSIFSKDAVDKMTSPEEMDRYLVVTHPGVWIVLSALIVILIGFFCWAALGHLETKATVAVSAANGEAVCFVHQDWVEKIVSTGTIRIAGEEYALSDVGFAPQIISEKTDPNLRLAGSLEVNTIVVPLQVEATLPDGVYQGEVVIDSVKPISFILN